MPTITRYPQSAFVLEHDGRRFAFDFGAYMPADTVATIGAVDASFVSHIHPDHFVVEHFKALGGPVYGPKEVHEAGLAAGLEVTHLKPGETVELPGITVTAILADHGPAVANKPIENLGYVIAIGDKRIWFLGDMALPSQVPDGPIDLVMPPIGGAGYVFTADTAADFVLTTGHEGAVLPVHYDTPHMDKGALERFMERSQGHFEVLVIGAGETSEL